MGMNKNNNGSLRPFFVLWGGQALSLLGSRLVQFSLIWWLTESTQSATVLGAAAFAGLVPQVVLGPFAGVLVDRWSRRLTMLFADLLVALATVVLAILFATSLVEVWHVFIILFLRALGGGFQRPAMQASTSLMVPKVMLTKVQGMNQSLEGGLNIVAAPLAALLLSLMPLQAIMGLDVVTALFAIVPLFFIRVPQPQKDTAVAETSFWSDMKSGLAYVRALPGLMLIILMSGFSLFLLMPAFQLFPLLVTQHFEGGALQYGLMEAALGIGFITGGVLLMSWGGFKKRMLTAMLGVLGLGTSVFLLGILPDSMFIAAVMITGLLGFMQVMTGGPMFAILQVVVEPSMQGRVFTLFNSLTAAMAPLGMLVAGPMAEAIGLQNWFVIAGVVTVVIGLTGFFVPSVWHLEESGYAKQPLPQENELIVPEM